MAAKQSPKKTDVALGENATREEKRRALDTAISKIEKSFGTGSIMKMGERAQMNGAAISTGSLTLDLALGKKIGSFGYSVKKKRR